MGTPRFCELGEFLTALKVRSGRSYEWIGKRTHTGKSTVQRYCTGQSVPPDFGTLERIARACGADTEDLARLFQHWERAISCTAAPSTRASIDPAVLEPDTGSTDRVERPRERGSRTVAVLLPVMASVLVLLVMLDVPTIKTPTPSPAAPTPQRITGPTWTLPPSQVPTTLFGVTIASATGIMPSFHVGAVRLWDSYTRWADIEPFPGEFQWSVLERLVTGARQADLPVLMVLGGTPLWANPTGPAAPYSDGARAAPPKNLSDWDRYVSAVVKNYRGRIQAYELWPLLNDPRYFNGSVATAVEMTKRASHIIRTIDSKATVVCPGMGNLSSANGRRVLQEFANAGGYNYCDVAAIKLYPVTATDPPETMLNLAAEYNTLLHESGVQPRLWNTGTKYSITSQSSLTEDQARDYAVRFFLVGIYARDLRVERMYFYSWGSSGLPLVLQATGGAPTSAAIAVEELQRWLAHAKSRSCGHGTPAGLPDHVWQCDFTIDDPHHRHNDTIRWTDSGTAVTTAAPNVLAVHHLNGQTTTTEPGDAITIGEEPILIEHQ